MGPSCQVGEDLRLATASFTPEKSTSVEAFECTLIYANSSDILWPPVVVAALMIARHIHFVVDDVVVLELLKLSGQVFLIQRDL